MNRNLILILVLLLLNNCSFDQKSGIWTESKVVQTKNSQSIQNLFVKKEPLSYEFNKDLKIKLASKKTKKFYNYNNTNNERSFFFNSNLDNIYKTKFSKIDNFNKFDPNILIRNNSITFFDNKGAIFKLDKNLKIKWKKNYYSKSEVKSKPLLLFGSNKNTLIVTDNLSKYYGIDMNSGKLLWMKKNSAPFNSEIKFYKDKFFLIDIENTIRCFSTVNGSEIWSFKTDTSFVKSQKKNSLIILNKIIYSNNSNGDITALNIDNGSLVWQISPINKELYNNSFLLKNSNLVAHEESIYFSNNQNQFFAIDAKNGFLNWKQNINSDLKSTIIDKKIFSISVEGFLIITDLNSGNIIRATNIFNKFVKKKRSKIKPVGFIVGIKYVYVTTDNGKLILIDIISGQVKSVIKIAKSKISRPYIIDKDLIIAKNNSIIRLN